VVIVRNFLYIIVKFAEDGIFILLIRKKSAIINNIQEVVIDVEDCRGILMAARDHLPYFWSDVKNKCTLQGIKVGSPRRGTELSIRATTGVGWTIHHRSDHIRPGVIIRPSTKTTARELVDRLQPAIKKVEKRVGREMVVELKETKIRKARIYLMVESFDGEDFSTWNSSITQAIEEWGIIMSEFREYL
tara:strand:- start:85 stop:651 length:567 start_codon:yes stop_codon:yes gene_type:complete